MTDFEELIEGVYSVIASNDCDCSDCQYLQLLSNALMPAVKIASNRGDKFAIVALSYLLGIIFMNRQAEGLQEVNQLIRNLELKSNARQDSFGS